MAPNKHCVTTCRELNKSRRTQFVMQSIALCCLAVPNTQREETGNQVTESMTLHLHQPSTFVRGGEIKQFQT